MTPLRLVGLVVLIFVVTFPATFVMNKGLPTHWSLSPGDGDQEDEEILLLDPNFLKGLEAMGHAQYDKAIAAYSDLIGRHPKSALAYQCRGDAYLAKNDLDRALLDYDNAVRLDPKNEDAKARAEAVREQRANR
jgi:tetratricopeptide (TPR) repeat protein